VPTINADTIQARMRSKERRRDHTSPKDLVSRAAQGMAKDSATATDIIDYVRAEWGLAETPRPIQRFLLKLVYGVPLDDRPDDRVMAGSTRNVLKVKTAKQFTHESILDIGNHKAVRVESADPRKQELVLQKPLPSTPTPGTGITGRILTWDKFRENITGSYNETEFLTYLYGDGPHTPSCRCNLSPEQHRSRLGRQMTKVVLRMGRRGTKTTLSQWITSYTAYWVMREYCPQDYFRIRRDQAIDMTLIATGKDQASDLMAPARAAMKRSPYLRRFVEADSARRITLNTPHNMDQGLDAKTGVHLNAAPCSARALRGRANLLALLEEYGSFYYELLGSDKSDTAIYTAVEPSTADFQTPDGRPVGLLMVISTPMTRESHMFALEQLVWNGDFDPYGLVIHLPSPWLNPLITTQALRSFHINDPHAFEQEYEARYLDQRHPAFTREEIDACRKDKGSEPLVPRKDEMTFLGVDLGLVNDGTGISVVAQDSKGNQRLLHHENIRRAAEGEIYTYDEQFVDPTPYLREDGLALDIEKIAARIDYVFNYWKCRSGIGDQWNAYGLKSHLKSQARQRIDLLEINQTHNHRIAKNFIAAVHQKTVTIYADEEDWKDKQHLMLELVRLQREQTKSGTNPKIKLSAPNLRGAHDDQYSSVSRALWAASLFAEERPNMYTATPARNTVHKAYSEALRNKVESQRRRTKDPRHNQRALMERIRRRSS